MRRPSIAPLLFVLTTALLGCDDGDGAPPPATNDPAASPAPSPSPAPDPRALHVMGTGAMMPVAMRLAEAWAARAAREGEPPLVLEASVGTAGGARAAADGAVDLGMISRPLNQAELARGLSVVPIARGAVVLAANPSVPVRSITSRELEEIYRGDRATLADGSPVTLLLRDREESANAALERLVPALRAPREEAYRARRFRVLYHDGAMGEALASTPSAIGVFDLGAIVAWRLPLVPLAIDGVLPNVQSVADGTWKASRDLAFVVRADRRARAAAFLAFATSKEARAVIEASGCVPLTGEP